MSGSPPEDFPPRWQFSLRRLLLLPVAVAAVFAPIAAFGAPGILLGLVIGWGATHVCAWPIRRRWRERREMRRATTSGGWT